MENHSVQGVREIEYLFGKLKLAWDRGDGEAYGACFTEDADYVTFQGEHLQGRKAIADTHQQLWNNVLRGSTLEGEIKKIHFVTPEFAIFHGLGVVKLRWQKTAPKKRDSINTNVAVKQNGEWKIAAFQNSRITGTGLMQKIFTKFSK
ncbi:SgcJ/EcaC family oxidoreductase [Paenibacillus nanensis]|uniref:SgcJ/EcaC family oxidoreductase n=1 Tax=Paenibacillus nanensis TaxID=393251 RepID=A0A3A1UNX4_9BACL|nr:SgcJ/EcaC family oxidoreductase [Paenibacillus nanensis]RIX50044.1 SgcJ/EcaC family oxidoreductase [Paenibacillus nanensis]